MNRTKARWNSQIESLEGRAMLSLTGAAPLAATPSTPSQVVEKAYATFLTKYENEETTILLSSSTPSANRATFNSTVTVLLNSLNTSIDSAVSALPTEATLEPAITAELLGASANSLSSELAAIASPPTTGTADVKLFNSEVYAAVGVNASEIVKVVGLATPPSPLPTGSALITYEVSTALSTFQAEYNAEVGSVLYAPNPSTGNINLTANRALFNATVNQNLTQLQAGLLAAVSTLDNSTLNTSITTAISTLKTQLLAVPNPSGAYTTSALIFSADSYLIINSTITSINSLVTAALPPS